MGPTCGPSGADRTHVGPHVGPMNFAFWDGKNVMLFISADGLLFKFVLEFKPYDAETGIFWDALQWRHNGHDGVSNQQPCHCLLNRLCGRRSKKTPKLRVTGLCVGNSPGTGEFPAQMASNAENVSIWWRHHELYLHHCCRCPGDPRSHQ